MKKTLPKEQEKPTPKKSAFPPVEKQSLYIEPNPEAQKCCICGEVLTPKNSWKMHNIEHVEGVRVPYCFRCEQILYSRISGDVGYQLGMFICCAAFNMPYKPDLFSLAKELGGTCPWIGYAQALTQKGYNNDVAGFGDGITDIKQAFNGTMDVLILDPEAKQNAEYKKGRIGMVEMWGAGPAEAPYTAEEYDLLEKHYFAMTSNRSYIDEQTDLAIQNICQMEVLRKRYMDEGDIQKAKQLADMIKTEKEGQQLRKKDEIPQDRVRVDDITLAIERAGLPMMDYDELASVLANYALHPPYKNCRDSADQMLLMIRNATAWNEGQPVVDRLPDEFAINDTLDEFQDMDGQEKQIYKDLNIYPLNMGGDKD